LAGGEAHDVKGSAPLLRMIAYRIQALLADKGYVADAILRNWLSPAFPIERLFNKLKNWRRIATRYDKTAQSYLGFVAVAAVKLWLPFVHEA
jgi:hypothetical protein